MAETYYAWNPLFDCVTKETDAAGATVAEYTQEPKRYGGLISQHRSGASSFYHYDNIGTTRALTDSSQNVTDTAVYTGFGEKMTSSGTTVNPFGFVGSLGYHTGATISGCDTRARQYAPRLGRWESRDPLSTPINEVGDDYVYCRNSATRRVDPSGLASLCVCTLTATNIGKWKAEALGGTWNFPVLSTNPGTVSLQQVNQITCKRTRSNLYVFTCRKCQEKGGIVKYNYAKLINEMQYESGVMFPGGIMVVGLISSIPLPGGNVFREIIKVLAGFIAVEWIVGFDTSSQQALDDIERANNRCSEEVYTGPSLFTSMQGNVVTPPANNKGYPCDSL